MTIFIISAAFVACENPAAQTATHAINYDRNGGTGSMEALTLAEGATAALSANAFTRAGYAFAGWAESKDATRAKYADKASYTMGGADVILYAVWSQNVHKANFHANGGTGVMGSIDVVEGSTVSLPASAFTKTNCNFAGWSESADAISAKYADKADYTMGVTDVAFYAVWTQNLHKVTFDANGGAGSMASQSIAEGASAALATNAFTYAGHSFLGWATSSAATSAEYTDGADFSMGSADVKLYALWGLAAPTITTTGDFRKTVAISAAGAGSSAEIRYTMDGSTPTASSALYSGTTPPVVAGHMVTRTVRPSSWTARRFPRSRAST